ncbi:MAG TPA: G1 family glutamic endopeptidase [Acidimicrobiales bacterium]|nr:G1 family glutamic endopeptidase [Acidimicrobiales bacterium]
MIPAPGPHRFKAATAAPAPWSSRNWSGYAVTGTGFTSVTGQWTVPTVIAPKRKRVSRFSSTWVGIDGFNNTSLIQAGTEQDWLGGVAQYQAWWEILPDPETAITMTVHPGDVMAVSITQGFPDWTITVSDQTTGKTFTTTPTYSGSLTSAEWIQEAPTVGNHIAALAHDSTVVFDLATVNGSSPAFVKADSGTMVKHRKVISIPSLPNPAQDGFAVAFGKVAPPAPII